MRQVCTLEQRREQPWQGGGLAHTADQTRGWLQLPHPAAPAARVSCSTWRARAPERVPLLGTLRLAVRPPRPSPPPPAAAASRPRNLRGMLCANHTRVRLRSVLCLLLLLLLLLPLSPGARCCCVLLRVYASLVRWCVTVCRKVVTQPPYRGSGLGFRA